MKLVQNVFQIKLLRIINMNLVLLAIIAIMKTIIKYALHISKVHFLKDGKYIDCRKDVLNT